MIDAKRLMELMEPEKLRELATHLEACHQLMVARRGGGEYYIDGLDSAAAVLREVAERDNSTPRTTCPGCGLPSENVAVVYRGLFEGGVKKWGCCACGAQWEHTEGRVDTDKVIEIDLDGMRGDCKLGHSSEVWCAVRELKGRCTSDGPAPGNCPLREGRIIIQAKTPNPTQPTQPPNEADIAPNADSGHSGINAAGSDENG